VTFFGQILDLLDGEAHKQIIYHRSSSIDIAASGQLLFWRSQQGALSARSFFLGGLQFS
jgi:hypothetical protein